MTGVLSANDLLKLGKTTMLGEDGGENVLIEGTLDIIGETTFHNLKNENGESVTITEIYDDINKNKEEIDELADDLNQTLIKIENNSKQIEELDEKIEQYKCTCKNGSGTGSGSGSGTNPGDGNENEGGGGNGEGNLPENFEQFAEGVENKFQDQDKKFDDVNNVLQEHEDNLADNNIKIESLTSELEKKLDKSGDKANELDIDKSHFHDGEISNTIASNLNFKLYQNKDDGSLLLPNQYEDEDEEEKINLKKKHLVFLKFLMH